MKKMMILFIVILFVGCSKHVSKTDIAEINPDGIYLVINEYEINEKFQIDNDSLSVIEYSDLFDQNEKNFFAISKYEYVPLVLATNPATEEQEDGRKRLFLQLTKGAGKRLEKFTKKHITKKAAIVIGNKVITVHKIRTVVDGGKLQITRCTDNACEVLYMELQDNIIGMPK